MARIFCLFFLPGYLENNNIPEVQSLVLYGLACYLNFCQTVICLLFNLQARSCVHSGVVFNLLLGVFRFVVFFLWDKFEALASMLLVLSVFWTLSSASTEVISGFPVFKIRHLIGASFFPFLALVLSWSLVFMF